MPIPSPRNAPRIVIQGAVLHQRSRPKPRNAGRANSRPMVVTRVPQSIPMREPTGRRVSDSQTSPSFPTLAIESARVATTRKAATAHRGRRQAGKPWNRTRLLKAGTSARWIFYTGPIPAVNHPATRFEKFFTKSASITVLELIRPAGVDNPAESGDAMRGTVRSKSSDLHPETTRSMAVSNRKQLANRNVRFRTRRRIDMSCHYGIANCDRVNGR